MSELHHCGLNRQAIAIRVSNGRLHPVHRGVYAVGHPAITLEGRFFAAVKACGPDARLSVHAAAAHYEFIAWEDRLIDVTVLGASHREHPGIKVHRATTLAPQDTRRHKGIPCTSPARTLLDLAATAHPRLLRRAVRQAQALHMVNVRELAEILARNRGREAHRGSPTSSPPAPRPLARSSRTSSSTSF